MRVRAALSVRLGPRLRSTDPKGSELGARQRMGLAGFVIIVMSRSKRSRTPGRPAALAMSALRDLFDGPLPWSRMRQGYQLVRLCDRYGSTRVDAACERALSFGVIDVPRIARLLKRDFERELQAEEQGALKQLSHHPRFGRDLDAFRTRATTDGGES